MQKVLLVTSLVASASSASIPRLDKRLHNLVKREHKTVQQSVRSITSEDKAAKTLSAQGELAKEGVVKPKDIENDPIRFFEISMASGSDCHTDMGQVQGMEMGRCTNTLSKNNPGDSVAHAMSEMWYKPNNGGFPIMATFFDHGCDWEKLLHVSRLFKTDFGFPPEYRPGNCIPVYGESSEPMFHMEAHWTDMRHYPDYNAILGGYDGKFNGCMNDRHATYGIVNADVCMRDDDSGMYSKVDVTNCNDTGERSVEFLYFYDPDCLSPASYMNTVEHAEVCVFDVNDFNEGMNYDNYAAYLEYSTRDCHKKMEMGPL